MEFIDERNFSYLKEGLTFTSSDVGVLDRLLASYNEQTGFINKIVEGNRSYGFQHKVMLPENQLIFNLDSYLTPDKHILTTADLMRNKKDNELPPMVHLNLQSPSLNVPQRIEIPLKYILKGLPALQGTHMVYLHAIQIDNGPTYSYYGRTKRGWMKRYIEHVKLAMKGSNRKFPHLYGNAIKARYEQLYGGGQVAGLSIYTGSYHVVCVAGVNRSDAHEAEHYLIEKHSLGDSFGLNMV